MNRFFLARNTELTAGAVSSRDRRSEANCPSRDHWTDELSSEIAEMFGRLPVPTYGCIGLTGNDSVIRKATGALGLGIRQVGRDLDAKRAWMSAYSARRRLAEAAWAALSFSTRDREDRLAWLRAWQPVDHKEAA
jgi:hypothetical protein